MDYSKIIDTYFRCPKCHKRHLRYWPQEQSSTDQKQGQGQYVCEHCQASFAEALFASDNLEQKSTLQESEERLKMLLETMDEQQALHFKQAVVKQAISYVEEMLPPEEDDDGHRFGIRLANLWLKEPTIEKGNWVAAGATGECIDGGVRYYDYPAYFLEPAFVAGAKDTWKAAHVAKQAGVTVELRQGQFQDEEDKQVTTIAQYAVLEWQIAAAQAILGDADIPPLS